MHRNPLEQKAKPSLLKARSNASSKSPDIIANKAASKAPNKTTSKTPSLMKLGACLIYEVLTIIALCFISAWFFIWLAGDATQGIKRLILQFFLWLSVGSYLVYCWARTGQTLAMQAWGLRLVHKEGSPLSLHLAIIRYLLASLSLSLFGFGYLWALVDQNKLFLHDRLLKCSVVVSTSKTV